MCRTNALSATSYARENSSDEVSSLKHYAGVLITRPIISHIIYYDRDRQNPLVEAGARPAGNRRIPRDGDRRNSKIRHSLKQYSNDRSTFSQHRGCAGITLKSIALGADVFLPVRLKDIFFVPGRIEVAITTDHKVTSLSCSSIGAHPRIL